MHLLVPFSPLLHGLGILRLLDLPERLFPSSLLLFFFFSRVESEVRPNCLRDFYPRIPSARRRISLSASPLRAEISFRFPRVFPPPPWAPSNHKAAETLETPMSRLRSFVELEASDGIPGYDASPLPLHHPISSLMQVSSISNQAETASPFQRHSDSFLLRSFSFWLPPNLRAL